MSGRRRSEGQVVLIGFGCNFDLGAMVNSKHVHDRVGRGASLRRAFLCFACGFDIVGGKRTWTAIGKIMGSFLAKKLRHTTRMALVPRERRLPMVHGVFGETEVEV